MSLGRYRAASTAKKPPTWLFMLPYNNKKRQTKHPGSPLSINQVPNITLLSDVSTLAIEWFDSGTVGVSGELAHGCMDTRKKEGECRHPEVAQLLPWPKGRPHLGGELVVVVGQVPHKPQQVPD